MIAPQQLRKPSNWQDFELLCKKLWGEIWKCEDTIQRNGRQGQKQNGVDVYGMPQGITSYYGIQCKGKDEYTHAQLTKEEIDREIGKACGFIPALKRFIFATTSNKDSEIEEYIRCKNIESIKAGRFEIFASFWEDIVDLLEDNEKTYKWYVNNCHYNQVADVLVSINMDGDLSLHPTFERKTIKYAQREERSLEDMGLTKINNSYVMLPPRLTMPPILGGPQEINHSWCELSIIVENIGSVMLDNQKIELEFSSEEIEAVDDLVHFGVLDSEFLQKMKMEKQEVFEYNNDPYGLVIEPRKPLVEKDSRTFEFAILPRTDVGEINIHWTYLSNGYDKEGYIKLPVRPIYKESEVIETTEFYGDIPKPRVEIMHYITVE